VVTQIMSETARLSLHRTARTAKLVTLPVAFAGRQAVGAGKRMIGYPADEVKRDIQLRTAQHIFDVLGEMRGCATKLGQILSLFQFALPRDLAAPYVAGLHRLQDSAPAMLPRAVHAVMAGSLGPDWRRLFREFDDTRPCPASIGQVHRAVWHDGRRAAVKIQYPGAREAVDSDLTQLRRMAGLLALFLPGFDIPAAIDRLGEHIRGELDYTVEAANQRAFARACAGDPDFLVPDVIAQQGDVLIGEWIGGTSLTRIVEWGAAQPERDRIAELATRFCAESPERAGLLYCDPHPGNYRIQPDGRLGVVDFGACAVLPPGFYELALDALESLLRGGPEALEAMIRRRSFVRPGREFDAVALDRILDPYRQMLLDPDFRMDSRWLRKRMRESADLRSSNMLRQLTIAPELACFCRMFLSATGVVAQLDAHFSFPEATERFVPGFAELRRQILADTAAAPVQTSVRTLRVVK
jgi:predicted unusual protein kinase regulating ubiquinone biosynthesis (AarF/ABC1/UbiB family)